MFPLTLKKARMEHNVLCLAAGFNSFLFQNCSDSSTSIPFANVASLMASRPSSFFAKASHAFRDFRELAAGRWNF